MASETNRRLPLEGLTVAVVGAGRIGSELIRNLGLMGLGRIDVYERDAHAADPLRSRHTVYDGDFWDTLTLARLQAYDFAVCTIDDPAARLRMNRKCLVANVNLVQAWTEGSLAVVSACPFATLADSACFECDSSRTAVPLPIASLKLSVQDRPAAAARNARRHRQRRRCARCRTDRTHCRGIARVGRAPRDSRRDAGRRFVARTSTRPGLPALRDAAAAGADRADAQPLGGPCIHGPGVPRHARPAPAAQRRHRRPAGGIMLCP